MEGNQGNTATESKSRTSDKKAADANGGEGLFARRKTKGRTKREQTTQYHSKTDGTTDKDEFTPVTTHLTEPAQAQYEMSADIDDSLLIIAWRPQDVFPNVKT